MPVTEAQSPNPIGAALVEELKWVHGMIRRDLDTVSRLAVDALAGRSGAEIRAEFAELATSGPLWRLKVNCLRYCQFVHMHHRGESALLFPELRRTNPALGPVVDKLEADHAAVSDLLDEVDAAVRALDGADHRSGDTTARQRLVDALQRLGTDLLAHLQYEEDHISDTLRSWTSWPYHG